MVNMAKGKVREATGGHTSSQVNTRISGFASEMGSGAAWLPRQRECRGQRENDVEGKEQAIHFHEMQDTV